MKERRERQKKIQIGRSWERKLQTRYNYFDCFFPSIANGLEQHKLHVPSPIVAMEKDPFRARRGKNSTRLSLLSFSRAPEEIRTRLKGARIQAIASGDPDKHLSNQSNPNPNSTGSSPKPYAALKPQTKFPYKHIATRRCHSLVLLTPLQDFLASLNIAHSCIESLGDSRDHEVSVPQFPGGVNSVHDTGIHLL